MFKGDEDFEGRIDIHSILNDASLNDELISLGWTDMHPAPKGAAPAATKGKAPPKPSKSVQQVHDEDQLQSDEPAIEHLDIGNIGVVDESSLQLTEHDLQDEGLLAEFEYISGGGHAVSSENNEEECESQVEVTSIAITAMVLEGKPQAEPTPKQKQASTSSVVTGGSTASGIPTAEEAKRNAVKCKREGNNAEALKWLRYAKQLESNSLSTPEIPGVVVAAPAVVAKAAPQSGTKASTATTATSNAKSKGATVPAPTQPVYETSQSAKAAISGDAFAPLESAINEASKAALKEAKLCEKSDTKQAVIKMREYKALQQELVVLQSRRQTPGAAPALFHWQSSKKEVVVENVEIAEDEVKVIIEGVYDIAGIVETHSSRLISVSYLLGIAKEETAPTVTPQVKYDAGKVEFSYQLVLPVLKRGRHVQQLYARKKATFDVVLHKGFWKGSEVLCQAVLPLADLLTKSKVGGQLPLKTVKESESSKKGKVVGGQLTAYVVIRSPLGGPEVVVTEERKLVIEPWPPVISTPIAPVVASSGAATTGNGTVVDRTSTPVSASISDTEPLYAMEDAPATPAPVMTGVLATVTEQEKNDPHCVDFIESNDVLEAEIAAAEALLQTKLDEDEQFNATMRLQLLRGKLQLLVYQVQSDALSMEQYLENIKARLKRDQTIALYFKTLGDKESVAVALQVMKRVQVMKKEIQNAEEAAQEQD